MLFRMYPILFVFAIGFSHVNCLAEEKAGIKESVIVASVNGESITSSDVERAAMAYIKKSGKISITKKEKQEIVKSMIRRKLLLTLPEVQALKHSPDVMHRVEAFENTIIIRKFMEERLGNGINVTDDQIKDFYEKNRDQFAVKAKVIASHILLRNRMDAERIRERLKNGEDFAELAKNYSIDLPMAKKGGSMGTIEKGKAPPELDKILFTMEPGSYSDIIETPYGWHIIRVDQFIPAGFQPLAEIKEKIKKHMIRLAEANAFEKLASELEKKADTHIFSDRL